MVKNTKSKNTLFQRVGSSERRLSYKRKANILFVTYMSKACLPQLQDLAQCYPVKWITPPVHILPGITVDNTLLEGTHKRLGKRKRMLKVYHLVIKAELT